MSDFSVSVHPIKDSIYFNSIYICISSVDWLHHCLKLYSKDTRTSAWCTSGKQKIQHVTITQVSDIGNGIFKGKLQFFWTTVELQSSTSLELFLCQYMVGILLRVFWEFSEDREELWPPFLQLMAPQGKLTRKKTSWGARTTKKG